MRRNILIKLFFVFLPSICLACTGNNANVNNNEASSEITKKEILMEDSKEDNQREEKKISSKGLVVREAVSRETSNNNSDDNNNENKNFKKAELEKLKEQFKGVRDFDSCVKAGGIVYKTFPAKCKDLYTGKVYTKK